MTDQRLQFSKTGAARYISHLDLMRTFERAFLRAGIPIRHTEGFNPHAYVSILLPLSVGFSSGCEILEFGLQGDMPMNEVPARLRAALPAGITVHRCYDALLPVKQLAFVDYIITMEYENGVPAGTVNAFRTLLKQDSLVVTKKSKKAKSGEVQVDIIPLIRKLSFEEQWDTITIDAVLRAQNPGLNPELLMTALRDAYPEMVPDFVTFHRKSVLDEQLKTYE
jgi:radical SAM-linked protein